MSTPSGPPKWFPTTETDWKRADQYGNEFLLKPDPVLEHALETSKTHGLPEIAVSAAQGKFMKLLLQSIRAKRVLEVGTLGGYSAIWMARALPDDGEFVTLEVNPAHASVAKANITYAGLEPKVKIIVGNAAETIAMIPDEPKFDLAFIDADKEGNATYVKEAKRLVRSGGVIIVDNVVRSGRTSDPNYSDSRVEGVRTLMKLLKDDDEIDATTLVTAGEKGFDGFLYGIRK